MSTGNSRRSIWSACALGGAMVLASALLWQALSTPRIALAQVPDSGQQRNEMIQELRISNQKLTEIIGLLREIRDAQTGQQKDAPKKPPPK